ncbi:MAG: ribosome silencing factor [Pseudomonadota bacterium]|nr:ribosome silencing factor [Pseudomonadota bacterium]
MTDTPIKAGLGKRTQPASATAADPQYTVQDYVAVIRHALEDVKAQDIVEIDVRGITDIAETMIIASGTSSRHVNALASNVAEEAKKAGFRPLGTEGEKDSEWILIDLGYVIVHVMMPATRRFYDLESLWKPDPNKSAAQSTQ